MSALNWDAVLEKTMGDEELARDVASAFLEETPQIFIALNAAIKNHNREVTKRSAHTIKGSLRMMSAIGHETAYELEKMADTADWDACRPLADQLGIQLDQVVAELKHIMG